MNGSKPAPKMSRKYAGRLGGLVGGKVRAERLTEEERKAIAKKAAEARWSKQKAAEPSMKEVPIGENTFVPKVTINVAEERKEAAT